MQVLYDPLQAYFPLLKQWIGTMGQQIQIQKQLDTLIETAGVAILLLSLLGSYGHVPLSEESKLPILQHHLTAPLLAEVQQQDVGCLVLRQRPDLGIDPVERKNRTIPQGEQSQASVFRAAEGHHRRLAGGSNLHIARETAGIKQLCHIGHEQCLRCLIWF